MRELPSVVTITAASLVFTGVVAESARLRQGWPSQRAQISQAQLIKASHCFGCLPVPHAAKSTSFAVELVEADSKAACGHLGML